MNTKFLTTLPSSSQLLNSNLVVVPDPVSDKSTANACTLVESKRDQLALSTNIFNFKEFDPSLENFQVQYTQTEQKESFIDQGFETTKKALAVYEDETLSPNQPNSKGTYHQTVTTDSLNPTSFKYNETIRTASKRRQMHGKACPCCSKYYECQQDDRVVDRISRHKYQHLPPCTPPGFWDIGFSQNE